MANRQRDPAKERFWRETLARFQRSQLTIREFCRREHPSVPCFYAWRAEVARRDRSSARPQLTSARAVRAPTFLPVEVQADEGAGHIDIILRPGRVIRLSAGFDPRLLAQAILALERLPC